MVRSRPSNEVFLLLEIVLFAFLQEAAGANSILRRRSVLNQQVKWGHELLRLDVDLLQDPNGTLEPLESENLNLFGQGKPIRIVRTGDAKSQSDEKSKKISSAKCGATTKVHSSSEKAERCPDACPFYAQNRDDTDYCTFACVPASQCASMNPKTQIGDPDLGVCRSCVVEGCNACDASATTDRCLTCQSGYYLKADGQCYFKYGGQWVNVVGGILAAIVLLVVLWMLELGFRPVTNQAGLDYGLAAREDTKLKMRKDPATGVRDQFPLFTNLLSKLVAGPGMTLHFNFQVFLMIWGVFVAGTWMCFAQFVDNDLWRLGTRKFGTPRENCILVAWGYETQQNLMWTKVSFLWIVYIVSFLMCMLYSVYQLRTFQDTDYRHKTMKDFVAMVVGLPTIEGSQNVEEDLKVAIERSSGQRLVGVSVAWDFLEHEEEINKAAEQDIDEREQLARSNSGFAAPSTEEPPMNPLRKMFYKIEQKLFGLPSNNGEEEPESVPEEASIPIAERLMQLKTSPRAFAVFESQADRDIAVDRCKENNGFDFAGTSGIELETFEAEPDTVQWQNFGHSTTKEKALKLTAGFGIIGLACLFWAVVFYAPYAYYVMTFNYENGREPGFVVGFAFSMIVVVGNAIMYEVCNQISEWVGFRFKDDREACYMILYCIACMFNVALDFVTTYFTAEKVMEGLGFRNYFGVPLEEIDIFTQKFETYGMQRSLAENTYGYAFPSTYLIPFLIEPFPTVIVPLLLGKMIVRTHPELQGKNAAEWLAMAPMEMGRYADLLLNVILGILIFYFPGGYTWMLFLAMSASHVWIYVFDHCRVLRSIPSCTFASFDIEWWAQAMFAPIMGIIASCLVFKSNCERGYHCLKGPSLIAACCFGWVVSTTIHVLCLRYVVPKFGKPEPEEDPAADETFMTLARQVPCSWFTANPVHCLRSKHKHNHLPPCCHFSLGKEKYMNANPKIGCFYADDQDAQPMSSPRRYTNIGVYAAK